ncbi:hypothetical protein ACNPQM_07480 [Streptomyces sp. NPDC056231]|uniref:hypothetical protein n=1 Tax=Streptomyces sp. NPDC056231 TaxID=3345755 RepID=UPI003AAEB58D
MRKNLLALTSACIAAAVAIPVAASPAAAAPVGASCSITGAKGSGSWEFVNANSIKNVNLTVTDTAADGHHVAIRLLTVDRNLVSHNWTLHHLYDGKGTSHTWTTTATDTRGLKYVYIEVSVMEGSDELAMCNDRSITNPYI